MNFLRRWIDQTVAWVSAPRVFGPTLIIAGTVFVGLGVYGFKFRHLHFGLVSALGCLLAAAISLFVLLLTDYVFHHAPLVFIPFCLFLFVLGFIQPHFGIGMGVVLWGVAVKALKEETS